MKREVGKCVNCKAEVVGWRLRAQLIAPCEPAKCTSIRSRGEKGICHKVLEWNLGFIFRFGAFDPSIDGTGRKVEVCEPIDLSTSFGGGAVG